MSSYVVTGAARGIGLEFINQISEDQSNVVFGVVRNKATAERLLALNRSNVHVLEADITDHAALRVAAEEVSKLTGGSLDYLINNAAIQGIGAALHLDGFPSDQALEDDLINVFKTNVIGPIHTTNAFLPLLKKGIAKKVTSITSGLGDADRTVAAGLGMFGPYGISKAALNMAVAKYASTYKPEGFVFLAISPGVVNTAVKSPTPEELERIQKMIKDFQRANPHWKGPITPQESVKLMLSVIYTKGLEDTGAFISHFGNKQFL